MPLVYGSRNPIAQAPTVASIYTKGHHRSSSRLKPVPSPQPPPDYALDTTLQRQQPQPPPPDYDMGGRALPPARTSYSNLSKHKPHHHSSSREYIQTPVSTVRLDSSSPFTIMDDRYDP